ncbi:lysozyme inhibitor LprI family protein [Duganella sp. sic0402]|uniref:lysozyme inhibitor LprI family protein n=1 Tax=Duganella sp. sic0402 TaxID=2854786 RepID=UPI001E5A53A8|nr:lysozyme inhibitor LprI family protein [Duganella sp. sic0402]
MKKILISAVLTISCMGAQAASFDCAKAYTPIEKTICADGRLSELDSQLMQVYKKSLTESASADAIKAEQRLWLKEVRNSCQDVACLKSAYSNRISALTASPVSNVVESTKAVTPDNRHPEQQTSQTNNVESIAAPTAKADADVVQPQSISTTKPVETKAETATTPTEETEVSPPSAGISGVFNAIYFVLTALFIAGLVNPKWILRWDANPSRKKLTGYFFALVLPVGLLGEFTKSEATRKYEAKVIAAKEAQKKAEAEAKQRERDRAVAASHASSSESRQMSPQQLKDMCNKGSMYALAYMNLKTSGQPFGSLFANMDEDLTAYPSSMRPSIQTIWKKMFKMVDAGRDPRMQGGSAQQTEVAVAFSVGCVRALQGSGLID